MGFRSRDYKRGISRPDKNQSGQGSVTFRSRRVKMLKIRADSRRLTELADERRATHKQSFTPWR